MIYPLIDLPPNVVGFKVLWQLSDRDFEEVVNPSLRQHVQKAEQLNCLLVLNNSIKNFTLSTLRNFKHLVRWKGCRRVAIVAESKISIFLIGVLNMLAPVELKAFPHEKLKDAIRWAANSEKPD